jgi:hypothetical protein
MKYQEIGIVGEGEGRKSLKFAWSENCAANRALSTKAATTTGLCYIIYVWLALLDSTLLEISPSIKEQTTDWRLFICTWLIEECVFLLAHPPVRGSEDSIVANCFLVGCWLLRNG